MKIFICLLVVTVANCGHITHSEKATSYQSINMEHFHAVPTYIKKEDKHLIEHPIPLGKSSSKVEIHHGDKHDHGYAVSSVHNDAHGHGHGDLEVKIEEHHDLGGAHALQEAEVLKAQDIHSNPAHYQDQGHDYSQFHGQLAQVADQQEALGHGSFKGIDAAHYEQLAAAALANAANQQHYVPHAEGLQQYQSD